MERQITDIITNLKNGKREEAYKLFKEYLPGLEEKKEFSSNSWTISCRRAIYESDESYSRKF